VDRLVYVRGSYMCVGAATQGREHPPLASIAPPSIASTCKKQLPPLYLVATHQPACDTHVCAAAVKCMPAEIRKDGLLRPLTAAVYCVDVGSQLGVPVQLGHLVNHQHHWVEDLRHLSAQTAHT
jgi:hypothetical protein